MILARFIRYATFVGAILGVWAMSGVLQTIKSQEVPIPPPKVAPPEKTYEHTVAATGLLEALSENVSVGVPVPGLVTQVFAEVSAKVKKGDPLFAMDDRELQAQTGVQKAAVDVAQANLEVARAQMIKAQDMLDRLKAVTDQRAISQDDLRNRANDTLVAKAQVAAAEAALASAKASQQQTQLLLDRLTVRAPRDGTVIQVNTREGEYASPGAKNAPMVLGDLEKLQVRADVDEQNATRVRPGLPAKAFIKGDTLHPIALTFVRIEPFVIPKQSLTGSSTERVDTRVLQVIFSLQRPTDTPLYVGQQVDVYIDAGDKTKP
ncbi:MAG: efflux RND transporter periplasmic adaptor subunit [Verrucomicrobiales bacterium]|nr:efflux RND transporter periplasmic adaptor subunit [Verrucomicrobiales bacterium]MCP5560504.1 efflux RND transporter periplasmic adaptor subunit [Verrucomicrobiaceae bacterium]